MNKQEALEKVQELSAKYDNKTVVHKKNGYQYRIAKITADPDEDNPGVYEVLFTTEKIGAIVGKVLTLNEQALISDFEIMI